MEDIKEKNKEEKPKRTKKQKVFLGLEIAGNIVFYLLIIALFLFAIFNINGGNGTDNFPNIFGKGLVSVDSNTTNGQSMSHENGKKVDDWNDYPISDGFNPGDLLWADTFDESDKGKLHIGDVIVFVGKVNGSQALITHRIVRILDDGNGVVTQGDKVALELSATSVGGKLIPNAYITEGTDRYNNYKAQGMTDAQITAFNYTLDNNGAIENVSISSIRGIVTSVTAGGGKVLKNLQDNYLFYFVIPVGVLLLLEIFLVIRNIVILRGEKNKAELEDTREAMLKDVEAEKERIRQELLAEMRAQGLVNDDAKEETANEENKETSDEENKDESTDESKEDESSETLTNEDVSNEEVKTDDTEVENKEVETDSPSEEVENKDESDVDTNDSKEENKEDSKDE